jgi:hypothetical protein
VKKALKEGVTIQRAVVGDGMLVMLLGGRGVNADTAEDLIDTGHLHFVYW